MRVNTFCVINFVLLLPFCGCDSDSDDANDADWALLGHRLVGEKLMLYGGENREEYLGCLSCSKYVLDAITNKYGIYGNRYAANSIWNVYGLYGSRYSPYSWRNPYATHPPAVVDGNGNIYGYFTVNKYFPNRISMNWLEDVLGVDIDE